MEKSSECTIDVVQQSYVIPKLAALLPHDTQNRLLHKWLEGLNSDQRFVSLSHLPTPF